VDVDNVDNEQGDNETEDEELPDGELVPGIHLVKINVTQPDGQVVERRFKYYMPISVDASKPISLIFEFHGSYTFDAGVKPSDPLRDISVGHTLIQHAIKENCVVCFPAGTVEMQEDGSGAVNWQYSEKHLPFVDAMIDYFRGRTPSVDMNRVYSTGQSSGAIFSFVLAYERPEVFAAITPRAGQMSLAGASELPKRAVPVRVFAGVADETVVHSAVLANMTDWAEKIGGYFASDMVLVEDSIEIENYKVVDVRYWTGGKADYQIYSLKEEGHGISISYCMPYMWEFMASHTLDGSTDNLFVTSSIKEIEAQCGQTIEFDVNYTEGAT
jgi:poly(3-hydroxybutyrate) depolymerase